MLEFGGASSAIPLTKKSWYDIDKRKKFLLEDIS
jgi:hypothetical protein